MPITYRSLQIKQRARELAQQQELSIKRLAADCFISKSQAKRYVDELRALALVNIVEKRKDFTRGNPTIVWGFE